MRQRGWAGALAMLLALLIVLVLAAAALRRYGSPAATAPAAADARGGPPVDAGGDAPAPKAAMDRARGLQDSVREQAAEMQKRLDAADQ